MFSNGRAKVKKGVDFIVINHPNYNSPSGVQNVSQKTEITSTAETGKIQQLPVPLKGEIDPSVVGSWRYHNPGITGPLVTWYIFKADGTFDYYADVISPTNPLSSQHCYWRIDGNFLEAFCKDKPARVAFLKRNDPATGKPALIIEWTKAVSRMYIAVEDKAPWK